MNPIYLLTVLAVFFSFWVTIRKSLTFIYPKASALQYNTALSLIHAVVVTSAGIILILTGRTENEMIIYPNFLSLTYFFHDCLYCYKDPIFLCHHICSIFLISATRYLANNYYNFWSTLLMIVAEITAIPQNHFFLMKSIYGETRKAEFNEKYYTEFKLFTDSFRVCRLVIIPALMTAFLLQVEESFYFWTLFINSVAIIGGSIYWVKGQKRMLLRMLISKVETADSKPKIN